MQNPSIELFFSQVDELTQTHLTLEELPTVVVMGTYNSGKSTLINNLLEQRLSPVDIIPTTPAPVRFSYGERFLARVHFNDRQVHTLTADELAVLLTRKGTPGREINKVEVRYKHRLLKKMHIVDTPGIDALHEPSSLLSLLPKFNHIVYLLQQRGLNEADRQEIEKLVRSISPGNISFWINCNLGTNDGTSLKESRQFLRQICGSEVKVHLTNTMDNENINRFRLFIENQAAVLMLRKITEKLKKLDLQIPDIIARSMRESNDANFLLHFWPAAESARLIINGQNILKTIPPVSQQIELILKTTAHPAVDPGNISVVYKNPGLQRDPVVIREKIVSLLEQAIADPSLAPYTKSIRQLESLHGRLKKENYLVTAAGGFSSGKSTFFNALMGEIILPAENRPTTFTITSLKYGSHKKATINYARQVTIPTHHLEEQQAILCRHELATLERWITDPQLVGQIYAVERSKNGRVKKITTDELLVEIELLKKSFARVKRKFTNNRHPWKTLFKKISAQKFFASQLADHFIIHFKDTANQELDLDSPDGHAALVDIAGSHLALRVTDIVVEHPAESLRLATFIDTPGLDSVYHHHREITTRYLPSSDCFFFFLNGKHILTQPDMGALDTIRRAMQNKRGPNRKLFIVVNFADTLTARERDKVHKYLQENLVKPSGGSVDPGNIHFISALDALKGRDRTSFSRLLRQLKERIWELRCTDNYKEFILTFKKELLRVIQTETNATNATDDNQLALFKNDVQNLLKEIKQNMAFWHNQIAFFKSKEDFHGFQAGNRSIKKGFLSLSRKSVKVLSCHDMSKSINSLLTVFYHKWSHLADSLTFSVLNTVDLQKNTGELLKKNFKLTKARHMLNQYITAEERRIYSSIKTMEQQIESKLRSNAPSIEYPNISPAALAAAHRYVTEINKLEKDTFGSVQR